MYEALKNLCDSEIVLSQELARAGIFPAIDTKLSYSRRIDKFCSEGFINIFNKLKYYNILQIKEMLLKE